MRDVHLPAIDLNLLPALDALLRLRNVTRAGEEVGLSQPAMSRALARLRDLLDDPLLVRAGGGLAPTARAIEIAPRVTAAVEALRSVYRVPDFSPENVRRVVKIAATDTQTILVAPLLIARLAAEAPGMSIEFTGYADVLGRMERGEIDFAFATAATPLPPGSAAFGIAADRLALVMRRGHPLAGRAWSLADYGRVAHVGVTIFGDGPTEIDAVLAAHGVARRIAAAAPHFTAALAIVAATDCVTTISRALAARFVEALQLELQPPPPEIPADLDVTLVWSRVRGADPVLTWVRARVAEAAAEAIAPPRARAVTPP